MCLAEGLHQRRYFLGCTELYRIILNAPHIPLHSFEEGELCKILSIVVDCSTNNQNHTSVCLFHMTVDIDLGGRARQIWLHR